MGTNPGVVGEAVPGGREGGREEGERGRVCVFVCAGDSVWVARLSELALTRVHGKDGQMR